MAETYKPGQRAPKTGEIKCTQHGDVRDHISVGETFPPCMHWGEHNRKECSWEYV